jgi:hypothetical protein
MFEIAVVLVLIALNGFFCPFRAGAGLLATVPPQIPRVWLLFREVSGWRFEVVDLDGRRIDKVLAIRLPVSRRML